MRRFKSFKSPILDSDSPVEFEIYGQTFRCRKALQGRSLLEFVSASAGDDSSKSAEAVLDFIDQCVIKDDRERFKELTNSEDEIVSMEMIADISSWLVELYTSGDAEGKDSAEKESSASSPGQTTTTSSSEEAPSETVSA